MNWHLKEFLKDPSVASLAATRPQNVEIILDSISFDNVKSFVEFGPGDGVFTEEILNRIPRRAKLIAIESNLAFVEVLKSRFNDPRLEIISGNALNMRNLLANRSSGGVDCLLSGIPLSFLETEETEQLLDDCTSCLNPSGKLIIYQALVPGHKAMLRSRLRERFDNVIEQNLAINLPPLFALTASGPRPTRQNHSFGEFSKSDLVFQT